MNQPGMPPFGSERFLFLPLEPQSSPSPFARPGLADRSDVGDVGTPDGNHFFVRKEPDSEPPPLTIAQLEPEEETSRPPRSEAVTRASEQVARPKTPERIGALAAGDARPDKDQIVGPSSAPLLLKPGEVPNVPETPIEAARRKTVVRVLDSVGMNQLRLLALARMTTDPTRSWTGSQMDEELNRLQGGEPGFQLGRDSSQNDMVSRYGVNFLQNKDLIHLEDEGVTRMRARAEQAEIAYATAGTLLAWQAENPEIPLQKIFGNLHRVAPILHRGYSNMRLAIAEQVLTRDGRSYSDISRALGESIQRTQIAIRGMTDADVLAVGESTVRPGWGRAGISMNPQYRQPLTDLIGHLKNLKSDDGIRIAKEVTEYLLGSEETVARLMAIARENAWNKNRSRPTR